MNTHCIGCRIAAEGITSQASSFLNYEGYLSSVSYDGEPSVSHGVVPQLPSYHLLIHRVPVKLLNGVNAPGCTSIPATALVCDGNITDPPSASVGADMLSGRYASVVQRQVCILAERVTPHSLWFESRREMVLRHSARRFRINNIPQHPIRIEADAFL